MQILWASVHILTHALKNFCRQNAINSMPWLGRNIQKQSFTGVLKKCTLKKCPKFTGEHPCRSKATLFKSHFGMGALLYICYIFSEHLFLSLCTDATEYTIQNIQFFNHFWNSTLYQDNNRPEWYGNTRQSFVYSECTFTFTL